MAKKGHIPWNKGLTKETDSRVLNSGFQKGYKHWSKGLTKETDERVKKNGELLSQRLKIVKRKYKMVTYTCDVCGEQFIASSHNRKCSDSKCRCKKCLKSKRTNDFMMKSYNISLDYYEKILELQNNQCAICHKEQTNKRLAVDHCHSTGKVRGLLCEQCNRILGLLKDNIDIVNSAMTYLIKNELNSWDIYFINLALLVSTRSKDPSTQVGAVLVKDKRIISTGYNGFPQGVNDNKMERFERPLKYIWTIHAEENCILNAVRFGIKVDGAILYTTLHPCIECAKSIIQSGVIAVVTKNCDYDKFPESWKDNFKQAAEMLRSSGVLIREPE